MTGCLTEKTVENFFEKRLPEESLKDLHQHVDRCPDCYKLLAHAAHARFDEEASWQGSRSKAPATPTREAVCPARAIPIVVGQRIGAYRLVRRLGAGTFGVVFEGVHQQIGRRVAIKVIRPHFAQHPEIKGRLFNEARAVHRVRSQGLVDISDHGHLPDGSAYLVMEYLEGESLKVRFQRCRALGTPEEGLPLLQQVAVAMEQAHRKGIIHRDLKPENVMVIRDVLVPGGERTKVLDFGLAKLVAERRPRRAWRTGTLPGTQLGTPLYMAPEQCRGESDVDAKADVYSLGVMLYELLAGRPPFVGEGEGAVLAMHIRDSPRPLREVAPSVPFGLAALVQAMLDKNPRERPAMMEVAAQLSALLSELSPGRRALAQWIPAQWNRQVNLAVALGCIGLTLVLGGEPIQVMRYGPSPHRGADTGRLAPAPPGMAYLAGGRFEMGSTPAEVSEAYEYCRSIPNNNRCRQDIYERELPVRQVEVSPFALDKLEVANMQFANWLNEQRHSLQVSSESLVRDGAGALLADLADEHSGIVIEDGRFVPRAGSEEHPVVLVTWDAAQRYCRYYGKRLPTEAEWEFAARGTERRRFPWGAQEPVCSGVVFDRVSGGVCAAMADKGLGRVGQAPQDRTAEGIFDLGGNAGEWVMDEFLSELKRYPSCAPPCKDLVVDVPAGSALPKAEGAAPVYQMIRGGSYYQAAHAGRAAGRSREAPQKVMFNIGFRCAVPIPR